MIKKILTLYGLILILTLTVQNTIQNSLPSLELKAQNFGDENDPSSWSPCPICHCNYNSSGDCCCGGVSIYAALPCFCNACLGSYNCENGHTCPNLQTGEGSAPSTSNIQNGGGGGYYTRDSEPMTQQDFFDYVKSFWSVFNPPVYTPPGPTMYDVTTPTTLMQAATRITIRTNITLATTHESGVSDNASSYQNIIDASKGLLATRSNYENAPGGKVQLSLIMLDGIRSLGSNRTISISEIAGGSHSITSNHYDGNCIDVNVVNGIHVSVMTTIQKTAFVSACEAAGATNVIFEYNHYHIEW